MRAIVYKKPNKVTVENVPDPNSSRRPTRSSASLRPASAAATCTCTKGAPPSRGRDSFGHENMGIVEEVGEAVVTVTKGDRVVLPFNVACGVCFNCTRGFTSACLIVNPDSPSGAYGYAQMGPYAGGQAEYLRVPFADVNCLKLPGQPRRRARGRLRAAVRRLSHRLPRRRARRRLPGATVAVFGAGPVGLLAAYSSILRGAAEVYVVDRVPERLDKARSIGAIPVDFSPGDPVEQIKEMRRKNPSIAGAMRPGEEKMPGVMCGIDAVGYQASRRQRRRASEPRPGAADQRGEPDGAHRHRRRLLDPDPKGVDKHAKKGELQLPWGMLFEKGITLGSGQTPVKAYNLFLRDLIIAGRAKPSFIVSHRLPLTAAPDAYEKFDARTDGYTKVVLKPEANAPA